ncbi:MAG: hypothetical protein DME26_23160 [Verrucomicrobia bacterium]|nr:MAG: hypothetical protein DME26_23160 [Verrucomicrobiota bacterium]
MVRLAHGIGPVSRSRRLEDETMNRRSFLQTASVGSTALAFTAPAHAAGGDRIAGGTSEGQIAFEFLARSNQDGPNVTHFGYLTHLLGLADDLLFAEPNVRTEATARFTFLAVTTLFLNQTPQADFNDSASFARGKVIGSYSTRYHNVLNVQAPNQGITTASVELTQLEANGFALGDHRLQLGRPGLRARLSANGQGTRTQVDPLRAFFLVGGNVVVTDP